MSESGYKVETVLKEKNRKTTYMFDDDFTRLYTISGTPFTLNSLDVYGLQMMLSSVDDRVFTNQSMTRSFEPPANENCS